MGAGPGTRHPVRDDDQDQCEANELPLRKRHCDEVRVAGARRQRKDGVVRIVRERVS